MGELSEILIAQSSALKSVGLNILSLLQDLFPATVQDVRGSHVHPCLVITPIVVVVHKVRDRDLQIPWNIVWDLVDVKFNSRVIPLQLAVGLRMEGRGQDVAYAHQPQVFSKGMRDIIWPVVRQ